MRRLLLVATYLLWLFCLDVFSRSGVLAASCGHNAMRHLQDQQLRKLLGDSYLRQQQARRLQTRSPSAPLTRLQKLLVSTKPGSMRITPVYQLEAGYMNADQTKTLKEVLVPGAINILQQYIKIRIPSSRPVKAVRESIDQYCGDADASVVFTGKGFNGTDQVYYITALNTGSCSDNIIAYTIICHLEPFTYRPNVAATNLCPKFWSMSEPAASKQVSALVHEMIHGLGFSDRMYPFLYDSSTGIQYDEVVREHQLSTVPTFGVPRLPLPLPTLPGLPRLTGAAAGAAYASDSSSDDHMRLTDVAMDDDVAFEASASNTASSSPPQGGQYDAAAEAAAFMAAAQRKVLFLVTPKLAAFAREYYGCSSLPGAPADALSEGSHWRQANINHELMQPASAEDSQRKRISQFTLNFLDDTGWYVTDKSSAQELEWGRGAGCGFVFDGCSTYAASHKHQTYYCSAGQANKDVCTYDSRGIGVCSAIPGTTCYTARADAAKPLLYCQDTRSFQKAGRQAFASSMQAVGGVVGSPSSRCFHTPQQVCAVGGGASSKSCSGDDGSAMCMEVACDAANKLFVLLRVPGGAGKQDMAKLPCKDGEVLDLAKLLPSKFASGQLTCPSASTVCPTLGCAEACFNGYCWKGRCYCHMEFTGPGCSQSLVPSLVARKAAQTLPAQKG